MVVETEGMATTMRKSRCVDVIASNGASRCNPRAFVQILYSNFLLFLRKVRNPNHKTHLARVDPLTGECIVVSTHLVGTVVVELREWVGIVLVVVASLHAHQYRGWRKVGGALTKRGNSG